MSDTVNARRYETYLALTQVDQRLAAAGLSPGEYRLSTGWSWDGADFWGPRAEEQIAETGFASLWDFGDIQVYLRRDFDFSEEEWAERLTQLAEDLMGEFPDILLAKKPNSDWVLLHWMSGRLAVTVNLDF